MKKMRRFLALALAVIMTLAMSVTAFADGTTPDDIVGNSDDVGTITVKGIEDSNLTVMAYPIVTASYDSNGNFSGYTNKYNLADITNPTETELKALAAKTDLTGGFELTYDSESNTYTATNKGVGMYLIVVPSNESTKYGVAVASIYYSNNNGSTNILNDAEITMATTIEAPATWIKKTVDIDVDKTVDGKKGESSNIGDTLNYEVTINPIPKYSGSYPVLNIIDTLSTGLTYTDGSLSVKVGDNTLTAGTYYTLTVSGQTITVNFVVDGQYTLNDYAGEEAVISYKAVINENAAINGNQNTNTVKLNYTKDSTVNGDDDDDEDKTYNYTYTIDGQTSGSITEEILNKYGEETDEETGDKLPLEGAEFTLYTNEACTEIYKNSEFEGTTTTDAYGQVSITGLKAGTYYLKETKAPSEYSLNTHIYKIVIAEKIDSTTGLLSSWSITIDETSTTNFTAENNYTYTAKPDTVNRVDIQNTKLSSLPSTGGIGTTIFTVAGIVIMVAAAGMFFASRKKKA